MPFYVLIVLALVQGITEFLPISSSAHLILTREAFGEASLGSGAELSVDVALHVGSLMAVCLYFRHDLLRMAGALLKPAETDARRLIVNIAAATLPILIVGLLAKDIITHTLRSVELIGWMTIIFGVALWLADRYGRTVVTLDRLRIGPAVAIGIMQVLALIPGVSRSGICMTAGRALGMNRTDAARFALLMSIPTILGAGTLASVDLVRAGNMQVTTDALLGGVIAFVSAWLAIFAMMRWLDRADFTPFVLYRLILGGALLAIVYL